MGRKYDFCSAEFCLEEKHESQGEVKQTLEVHDVARPHETRLGLNAVGEEDDVSQEPLNQAGVVCSPRRCVHDFHASGPNLGFVSGICRTK